MNQTLVIYDSSGTIFYQVQGDVQEPSGGVLFMWLEIPEGRILRSIDTTGEIHIPVYEDMPKNELDDVKEQLTAVQIAIAEILGV